MVFFRQLGLLLQKELLVIWRSKKWFICEFMLGFLALLMIHVVITYGGEDAVSKSYSFEAVEISGDVADLEREVKNIATIYKKCCLKFPERILAFSSESEHGREIMSMLEENYNHSFEIKQFKTQQRMVAALKKDANESIVSMCTNFIGGIHFSTINLSHSNPQLNYRFYVPKRGEASWKLDEFWPAEGPYTAMPDINGIPGEPDYWSSGFLSFQHSIEKNFLELLDQPIEFEVFLQRMPMPESRVGGASMFLKMTPTIWSIILLATMLHTTKNIVDEKEAGIKTYMMVMGMDSMAFYASHFLTGCLKMFIIIVACAGYLSFGLMNMSTSLFVAFSLLYGLGAILFAVLITTIFRKPTSALMAIIAGWVCLFVLNNLVKTSTSDIGFSALASLNYFTAFKLGINAASSYETRMEDLGWLNCFSGSAHSFTIGLALLMLIFDCICMTLMIYYLDSVVPTDESPRKHPLFFLKFLNPAVGRPRIYDMADESDGQPDSNQEGEKGLNIDEADIDIQKMSKLWESTGQLAVDNLSFRAFRGQVTVLLGHNGAGKSTTFSALCGATSISSGNVWICQQSVADNLRECQKQISYCPQYNPLFARLTVREHLQLYARLKSTGPRRNLSADIEQLTTQVGLADKLDTLAQNLSGGMKRKLCVAMSLIGDSRVVLLDEPTAGMDPEARHHVSVLLKNAKHNRTVLLTTHYMDEADLLGDRIVIMVKGRVACNGSPEFLKNKFGTGYVLSMVVSDDSAGKTPFDYFTMKILHVVRKHAPEARIDKVSAPEFQIVLPVIYKKFFANLFEELENRQAELRIHSFGLSFNTLEQVFLKVGELGEQGMPEEDQVDSSKVAQFATDIFRTGHSLYALRLWLMQLWALLRRHSLNALRNKIRTFLPIVLSLLFFIIFGLSIKHLRGHQLSERELSLSKLEPVTIPLLIQPSTHVPADLAGLAKFLARDNTNQVLPIPNKGVDLQDFLIQKAYSSPPLGLGAAVYHNRSTSNDTVHSLFNGAAYHSPPMALLLVSNAMLRNGSDAIQLTMETYGDSMGDDLIAALVSVTSTMLVALVVIVSFSSMTSTFVMPLVEDRQRRFKHQMTLTKMHIVTYWASVLLWNLMLYTVFCLVLSLILTTFGWVQNCLTAYFVLWGFYFWSCVPFVYCASFLFDSAVRAYTALLCWMVVSMVVVLFLNVFSVLLSHNISEMIGQVALLALPSYTLAKGIITITPQCIFADETESIDVFGVLKDILWPMVVSGAIFWVLLCCLQSRYVALKWHQLSCRVRRSAYQVIGVDGEQLDDKDVAKERAMMRTMEDTELALAVRELYKYYGGLCAVRNLTFGVKHSDCFGLLGVNGAGKTTTFDILTGLSFSSSGCAMINGIDVIDSPAIGYCPQFDALPMDLTGREVLYLLAQLNGFADAMARVDKVLWAIHMTEHADKLVQYYSGGQKRRLSIGTTLISKATLIMLDEPTAGIDPTARRHIWELLLAVRQQNVAILLTSHSMEECEVLCNRIGFMNKGSLVGIGSSQHLKSRFGNSFLLTFTIENPGPGTHNFLDNLVVREFNALHTQDSASMSTLHWEIPKTNGSSWGALFQKAQSLMEKYPAVGSSGLPLGSATPLLKDFSVTQNSLEQVFLRMAHMDGMRSEQEEEPSM